MLRRQPEKRLPLNKILASEWFEEDYSSGLEMNEDKDFMDRITKYYVNIYICREIVIFMQ